MTFQYELELTNSAESGEPELVARPQILIRVIGLNRKRRVPALVDTGADYTILPRSLGDLLRVPMTPGNGPPPVGFGGHELPTMFGDVQLELTLDGQVHCWLTRTQFYEYASPDHETVVLGHVGFLEFFTATFDCEKFELTLTPNRNLLSATI
jgi:hypothetical protein